MLLNDNSLPPSHADEIVTFFSSVSGSMKIVLDDNRQILLANRKMLEWLGISEMNDISGKTLGEALRCSNLSDGGTCGHTKYCPYCFFNSIFEQIVSENCELEIPLNDEKGSCFRAFSRQFHTPGKVLTAILLVDITEEKRRKMLERTFFHDLLNSVSALEGSLALLNEIGREEGDYDSVLEIALGCAEHMSGEIRFAQKLTLARENNLSIQTKSVSAYEIARAVRQMLKIMSESKGVALKLKCDEACLLETDETLLSRSLINLLKNAIEASSKGETVTLNIAREGSSIRFDVCNNAEMPLQVSQNIFKYAFSTKGPGRGIGTYSVKLFIEKYLGGHVSCKSGKEGTVFSIVLPTLNISQP
ncbi:MAG: HAMP domain-containing histidine kinase [Opitutales bacterium]|nr:HAMP domain-containing histidine kinase [Opitutales bacterium]